MLNNLTEAYLTRFEFLSAKRKFVASNKNFLMDKAWLQQIFLQSIFNKMVILWKLFNVLFCFKYLKFNLRGKGVAKTNFDFVIRISSEGSP
jgi:hypothetical protein